MRWIALIAMLPLCALAQSVTSSDVRDAGIRAQLGAQGFSSEYIEWYLNRLPSDRRTGITARRAVEQERATRELSEIDAAIAEIQAEKARRSDAREKKLETEVADLKRQLEEIRKQVAIGQTNK